MGEEVLCVDIRGNTLKYIVAKNNNRCKTVELSKHGSIVFPDIILDNYNLKSKIKVIKNFLIKEEIMTKKVYINISSPSTVLRIVKIPFMKERDIGEHLKSEINQYIPVDIETTVVDYKILNTIEENGSKTLEVMIIAVPQQDVENCTEIFKEAGLNPLLIDLYPNVISKIFIDENKTIAVVDVNSNILDFEIIKDKKLFMYSNITLENDLKCEFKENIEIELAIANDPNFEEGLNQLIGYIKSYLNFYASRHHGAKVDLLYIFGEIALIKKIEEYFKDMLQIPSKNGLGGLYILDNKEDMHIPGVSNYYSSKLSLYATALGLARGGA